MIDSSPTSSGAGPTRPGWWREAALVADKDLRLELRSRVAINHVLPFVAVVVMLFGIALDADTSTLRRAESGLFWVTIVFASMLVIQRNAGVDRADGLPDALRLSGLRPAAMYAGKVASLTVQLVAIALVLAATMIVIYGTEPSSPALLVVTTLLGVSCIAAAGGIYGPLAAGLAGRETVLSLLLLPVLAPVLLAATRAFEVALGRGVGAGWPWVGMLGMLLVTYATLGAITAGPLLDET